VKHISTVLDNVELRAAARDSPLEYYSFRCCAQLRFNGSQQHVFNRADALSEFLAESGFFRRAIVNGGLSLISIFSRSRCILIVYLSNLDSP